MEAIVKAVWLMLSKFGAGGETRTPTESPPVDFESTLRHSFQSTTALTNTILSDAPCPVKESLTNKVYLSKTLITTTFTQSTGVKTHTYRRRKRHTALPLSKTSSTFNQIHSNLSHLETKRFCQPFIQWYQQLTKKGGAKDALIERQNILTSLMHSVTQQHSRRQIGGSASDYTA